jgi:putative transposase
VGLMRDNGSQPTALACMRACATLGIQQAFTRANNPQGNADTERAMRTLKEGCRWRQAWSRPFERRRTLGPWIDDDNGHDLHAGLGDKTPGPYEREYHTSHSSPFAAA